MSNYLETTIEKLPQNFGPSVSADVFKGLIKRKSLYHAKWRGDGPPVEKILGKLVYERESFVAWIKSR